MGIQVLEFNQATRTFFPALEEPTNTRTSSKETEHKAKEEI